MIRRAVPLGLAVVMISCTSAAAPAGATRSIDISQFQFRPATIEVPVGTTVEWRNADDALHTATSGIAVKLDSFGTYRKANDGVFDGPMDGAETSFRMTFDRPGRFPYFCDRHPHMVGTVIVTASSHADHQTSHDTH